MKPLQMSESEIRMRYRDGASAQILADLNACGWDRIKKIVGEPIEVKENKPRGHIDEKRARDLHAEGKTDKEMSIELRVSRGAVALWRSRRGFEANKKEEIMIKETEPTEQDKPTETEMFFADVAPEPNNMAALENTIERLNMAGLAARIVEPVRVMLDGADINSVISGRSEPIPCVTLEPRDSWESRRTEAVRSAIMRHIEIRAQIPAEWVIEWNERCEK